MRDSLAMLLKTHGEKMSLFGPTTILMKTNELKSVSRDVDENKVSCAPG
jgi:aspartate carbamoyltransferase catalytic subunit